MLQSANKLNPHKACPAKNKTAKQNNVGDPASMAMLTMLHTSWSAATMRRKKMKGPKTKGGGGLAPRQRQNVLMKMKAEVVMKKSVPPPPTRSSSGNGLHPSPGILLYPFLAPVLFLPQHGGVLREEDLAVPCLSPPPSLPPFFPPSSFLLFFERVRDSPRL